jgi:hypothetical protein
MGPRAEHDSPSSLAQKMRVGGSSLAEAFVPNCVLCPGCGVSLTTSLESLERRPPQAGHRAQDSADSDKELPPTHPPTHPGTRETNLHPRGERVH